MSYDFDDDLPVPRAVKEHRGPLTELEIADVILLAAIVSTDASTGLGACLTADQLWAVLETDILKDGPELMPARATFDRILAELAHGGQLEIVEGGYRL